MSMRINLQEVYSNNETLAEAIKSYDNTSYVRRNTWLEKVANLCKEYKAEAIVVVHDDAHTAYIEGIGEIYLGTIAYHFDEDGDYRFK